jgi:hypothetical protein
MNHRMYRADKGLLTIAPYIIQQKFSHLCCNDDFPLKWAQYHVGRQCLKLDLTERQPMRVNYGGYTFTNACDKVVYLHQMGWMWIYEIHPFVGIINQVITE